MDIASTWRWVGVAAGLAIANGLAAHEREPPRDVRAGCLSATDGCRVCKLDTEGRALGCSFPGIACAPVAWSCTQPVAAEPPQSGRMHAGDETQGPDAAGVHGQGP